MIPQYGTNVDEGKPLIRIEKKDEELKWRMQLTQGFKNLKAERTCLIYSQTSLSKDFENSSLRIIPGVMDILRERMISCPLMIPSMIWHPSMYPDCSSEMIRGIRDLK